MSSPSRTTTDILTQDAIPQLLEKRGRMADLGKENGRVMLDWVDAVPRLLASPEMLQRVEDEARQIVQSGIRYVVWAGMGGSVMIVRVLAEVLPWLEGLTILPLDSTDPAALNSIVTRIAADKSLSIHPGGGDAAFLNALLDDVMMIGVAMGMTSEEPITHLRWFVDLLEESGLPPEKHTRVMALPHSFLGSFAGDRELPVVPLQPDGGTGTGGRMSAPGTRVFLLPAALWLAAGGYVGSTLQDILTAAWQAVDPTLPDARAALTECAAALAEPAQNGVCRLLLDVSDDMHPLIPWIEQLLEESLGKEGKGVLVFDGRTMPWLGAAPGTVRLANPRPAVGSGPEADLTAIAALCLRWESVMALYGYLHDIPFAGQPAVENYKARARALRESGASLRVVDDWRPRVESGGIAVLGPPDALPCSRPGAFVATGLAARLHAGSLPYIDVTVNGEISGELDTALRNVLGRSAERLQTCFKLRRAPAAYHSTEQSEMDGPAGLFSIRLVTCRHDNSILGAYDDTFLLAQAVGTWQAMIEAGRACYLAVIDGLPTEAEARTLSFLRECLEV